MSTVVFKFKTRTEKRGRIRLQPGEKNEAPVGSTPRITKLMALAIKFDPLVPSGQVKGRDPISSREVIRLAAEVDWERWRTFPNQTSEL